MSMSMYCKTIASAHVLAVSGGMPVTLPNAIFASTLKDGKKWRVEGSPPEESKAY
jgi:hypothetical protein